MIAKGASNFFSVRGVFWAYLLDFILNETVIIITFYETSTCSKKRVEIHRFKDMTGDFFEKFGHFWEYFLKFVYVQVWDQNQLKLPFPLSLSWGKDLFKLKFFKFS